MSVETGDSGRSLSYPPADYDVWGSVVSSPAVKLGLSPSRNDVWAFYAQFLCDFRRVLVHFGRLLSGRITSKIQ